jgi:hypothetical protein
VSSFGIGIGSFVTGLTKGLSIQRQMDQQDLQNEVATRRLDMLEKHYATEDDMAGRKMKIFEENAARAAKADEFNMEKSRADFDYQQGERAAEAPVRAAERKAKLTGFQDETETRETLRTGTEEAKRGYDAERSRSIKVTRNADGSEQTVEVECVDDPGVAAGDTFTLGGTITGNVAYVVTSVAEADPIDGIQTWTVSASRHAT